MRWICKELGFDRVVLKNDKLRLFFLQNAQSAFYDTPFFSQFLAFMSTRGAQYGLTLKQSRTNLLVIKEKVDSFKEAHEVLSSVQNILEEESEAVANESA